MLPLLFAFGNASLYVDRLAEQSQSTLAQAVQATRTSRVLIEQLNVMERSARQYFVLEDKLLLDNYQLAHDKFIGAIRELSAIPLGKDQRQALRQLTDDESRLYNDILIQTHALTPPETIVAEFYDLSGQAQEILEENNRLIDRESQALSDAAQKTQQMMLQQTVTLVPVALIVALIITFLVAQPIRRMDAAIRRLGEGKYSEPISIDGPGDLHSLGERLNWLRGQLEELEQQKQRFLRHISHELKTPLTAIREGSELLHDEVGGTLTPQQREIAEIIRESSVRLQKMIENLLSFTAVQFQKPTLRKELVSVNKLMEKVLESYALSISSKEINIIKDFIPQRLRADKEKLQTILDNLISNAIKYTPQSGTIHLSIKDSEHAVVIEVHDGGPGVMAADRARLFDPFYRGSGVQDSLIKGSGLGLSIAKEYVDAHGGEITLLPSTQGAHFRVYLPVEPITL
ncbi:two-component system, NtrC family, sensor histidine kinase GlrK [Methylophilaceae bacterium]|nr:two-component system, NtrC family, sensor histidine kinase GlrK [Methylophilaceae bacterium]